MSDPTRTLVARYRYVRTDGHVFTWYGAYDIKADGGSESDVIHRTGAVLITRRQVEGAVAEMRKFGRPRIVFVSRYRKSR